MKLRTPQVKLGAPKFVTDIFRDLRDRHLLIPVVALLVAIVAVPVALKSSAEPAPPPPAVGGELEGVATQPAVLAESETVRDYRERLDALKSKNPFQQALDPPKVGAGQKIEGIDDSLDTGAPTGTPPPPTDTGTTSTSGVTSSTDSTDSGSDTSSEPTPPSTTWFTWRIDVLVGPQGSEKERNGVERLTLLPSKSKPVVAFLGATEAGKKAVFLVSDDVSSTSGDGSCFPSQSSCEYLVLRDGQARTFEYAPDGVTYKLKLRKIRAVKLDKDPGISVPKSP